MGKKLSDNYARRARRNARQVTRKYIEKTRGKDAEKYLSDENKEAREDSERGRLAMNDIEWTHTQNMIDAETKRKKGDLYGAAKDIVETVDALKGSKDYAKQRDEERKKEKLSYKEQQMFERFSEYEESSREKIAEALQKRIYRITLDINKKGDKKGGITDKDLYAQKDLNHAAKTLEETFDLKEEDLPPSLLEQFAATTAIIAIIGSLFFLAPGITGNVTSNLTNTTSKSIGGILFAIGLFAGLFWFKRRT